jgi:hypothetical protein
MSGLYGPADVTVTFEDSPGGTARNIENFLINGISAKVLSRLFRSDALGDVWEEHVPTGKKAGELMTLEGLWDTTATTGSHVLFKDVDDGPQDDTRELVVNFGDSKSFTFQMRLMSFEVLAENESVQRFRAELQPTGAVVIV